MKKVLLTVMSLAVMFALVACSTPAPAPAPTPAPASSSAPAPVSSTPAPAPVSSEPAPVSSTPAPVSSMPDPAPASSMPVEETMYSIDFMLHNYSNADLVELYVSPTTDDYWGDDIMRGAVLLNGSSMELVFDTGAPAGTTFDIRTLDDDGDQYDFFEIPLTELTDLSLYVEIYSDGSFNNYFEWS